MPGLYLRQKQMPDCVGRIDYMGNPQRQKEKLLAFHDGASELMPDFWGQLASESGKCQARELHGRLPNSLLQRMSPEEIVAEIQKSWNEETNGRPCAIALHNSPTASGDMNLHFHLMYPERDLLQEPVIKVADRPIYFDEDGKRRYRKSEILDENGGLRRGCRIVAKGEIYERRSFGPIDNMYSSKGWLQDMKEDWFLPLVNGALRGDVEIELYDPAGPYLPLQHEGKGPKAADIRETNRAIRQFNDMVSTGEISEKEALQYKELVMLAPDWRNELISIFANIEMEQCPLQELTPTLVKNAITIGTDPRTRHDPLDPAEIEKQKLRRLYKEASVAWAKYKTCQDPALKKELLRAGKAASARIDAQRRAMGDFSEADYQALLEKQKSTLRKERAWIRSLKERIDRPYNRVSSLEDYLRSLRRRYRQADMKWFGGREKAMLSAKIAEVERQLREAKVEQEEYRAKLRGELYDAIWAYRENKRAYKDARKEYRDLRRQRAAAAPTRSVDELIAGSRGRSTPGTPQKAPWERGGR